MQSFQKELLCRDELREHTMTTHINEGEITLVLRERVPCRRQISPISGVHVRAGTVQAGAPLVFGEVMVLSQGGRLCLRGQ